MKKYLQIIFGTLLFLLLIGFAKYPLSVYSISSLNLPSNFGPITKDHPFNQCIELRGKTVDNVQILFATFNRNNNSNYNLQIFDKTATDDKLIYEKLFNASEIKDNLYKSFDIKEYKFPQMICIKLLTEENSNANALTVWLDQNGNAPLVLSNYFYLPQLIQNLPNKTLTPDNNFAEYPKYLIYLSVCLYFLVIIGFGVLLALSKSKSHEKTIRKTRSSNYQRASKK